MCAFNTVEKWTYAEMNKIFNFKDGTFRSINNSKNNSFPTLDIYRYGFIKDDKGTINPQIHGRIHLKDLIPVSGVKIDFDSASGNEIKTVEVEYIFGSCDYHNLYDISNYDQLDIQGPAKENENTKSAEKNDGIFSFN